MRIEHSNLSRPGGLAAAALLALAVVTTTATAAPLQGTLRLRPVTPSDVKDYALPTGTQTSAGLTTIGVGQPAYLEAQISLAIPVSDIVSVDWVLTNKPPGSTAALVTSPLGANVPVYSPADRLVAQVAGRRLLRPDLTGSYTVVATIVTASNGTTNLTQTITAGTYAGANTCSFCHSGGVGAPDKYSGWTNTLHSKMLTSAIDGLKSDHYSKNCISCHTVGYDVNTNAVSGGFDDVAAQLGWTFPTVLTNGNWAAMPEALKNLSNIQCENCHGPGSEHFYSDGILGNTNRISVTFNEGDCGQCHDSKNNHKNNAEWANSKHAITTTDPSGRESCVGCHTGSGFARRAAGATTLPTDYNAITCSGCHDPHDATKPHQIRMAGPVTLMDTTTTITNAGAGALCMNCHLSRRNAIDYVETASPSSHFGPHEGPQADMLAGANAITYGKTIPSSAHSAVVEDSCVHCHMQSVAATEPGFLHAGGHTFNVSWDTGTNKVELVGACKECHGPISTFNFARDDYDGDGIIEGVQTEVQHLMDKLAFLLPPVGVPKSELAIDSTWTRPQLRAGYNYQFVNADGSKGVHNAAYAVGILKASISDLSGDANNDGIADWWQTQYFGSINDPNAAPNASPAGDGIPNWLKASLRLDPNIPGVKVPDGMVWAQGNTLVNPPGMTNMIHIYTAAEVAFNTEQGKRYQLQSISSLDGTWQNVGDPIEGTGTAFSYVTPTRLNVQQFYRVVTLP